MLPARRTSKSRSRTRRAHEALKPMNYTLCPKCSQAKLPHAACSNCGYVNPSLTLKLGKEETA
jgi:large subunit ribosomal protein L32